MKTLFISLFSVFIITSCNSILGDDDLKIVYYPDSEVIKQSVEFKDGKKDGLFQTFYRNGSRQAIQHYRRDTITDTSFFFHENGKLSAYQIFDKGKMSGCWKKFNKEGKEYWNACFQDGKLHGPAEEYSYKTLKLLCKKNYNHGREEGKQEFFYPNGKLQSVVYFSKGYTTLGTEEWTNKGEKIDNDFKISITEKNEVLLNNMLSFYITLENPQSTDEVYQVAAEETGNGLVTLMHLIPSGNQYNMQFEIPKGGFIMKEIHLAVYRKTAMGNTYIKKTKFIASANNF